MPRSEPAEQSAASMLLAMFTMFQYFRMPFKKVDLLAESLQLSLDQAGSMSLKLCPNSALDDQIAQPYGPIDEWSSVVTFS